MKTKATCPIILIFCLVTVLSASPFVPLEWQTLVKSDPFAGQRKHVGWIRDQNGDFIDDAFDGLARDETTRVIVQLSECLCPEDPNAVFGIYGRVVSTGVLVAHVILDDVPVYLLDDLASEPVVAALERPVEYHDALNVSTRAVRSRKSKTYQGQSFSDMGSWDGSGVTVAIVDSGIWNKHGAFKNKYAGGYDATANPPAETDPDDTNSHGTGVASIAVGIGAVTNPDAYGHGRPSDDGTPKSQDTCQGMAPGAKFLDVKVTKSGTGQALAGELHDGLKWIFKNGKADVINISKEDKTPSDGKGLTAEIINGLVANGFHVVVCAGNSGNDKLGKIAAADLAITVSNVDDNWTIDRTDDTIHSTSSYGPRPGFDLNKLTEGMLKPDIAAPGTHISMASIFDSDDDYIGGTGTSMSAPHVAGAIALLLSMPEGKDLPPESMKELLKQTAFRPKSFTEYEDPTTKKKIPGYDIKWGSGMLDVYEAAQKLKNGITDMTFPTALKGGKEVAKHSGWPKVRRCLLQGKPSYANDTDIIIKDKDTKKEMEPVRGHKCIIEVYVENRNSQFAEDVVVSVGVKELIVGNLRFYVLGSKKIDKIDPGVISTPISFDWTPDWDEKDGSSHQCIQATIAYARDTDFTNNTTQRNVKVQKVEKNSSPSQGVFRVENPLNEPATIVLEVKPDAMALRAYTFELEQDTFYLRPEDCPVLNTITFFPRGPQPVGQTAIFDIAGTAFSESNEDGIELSGVVFKVIAVDPGLERVYTSALHGPEGMVDLPLALSGSPTSDPRRQVNMVRVFFNVPVRPVSGISLHEAVRYGIRSDVNNLIPEFNASFEGRADSGTDLTIEFFEPLANEDIYTFNFGHPEGLVDLDGDVLTGDGDFELHVLQGDTDGNGSLDEADISFVRDRIGQTVEFSSTCRADVNQDGVITNDDIQFIINRLSNIVQFDDFARFREKWLKGDIELVGDLDGGHDLDLGDLLEFASDWLDYIPVSRPFELILVAGEK